MAAWRGACGPTVESQATPRRTTTTADEIDESLYARPDNEDEYRSSGSSECPTISETCSFASFRPPVVAGVASGGADPHATGSDLYFVRRERVDNAFDGTADGRFPVDVRGSGNVFSPPPTTSDLGHRLEYLQFGQSETLRSCHNHTLVSPDPCEAFVSSSSDTGGNSPHRPSSQRHDVVGNRLPDSAHRLAPFRPAFEVGARQNVFCPANLSLSDNLSIPDTPYSRPSQTNPYVRRPAPPYEFLRGCNQSPSSTTISMPLDGNFPYATPSPAAFSLREAAAGASDQPGSNESTSSSRGYPSIPPLPETTSPKMCVSPPYRDFERLESSTSLSQTRFQRQYGTSERCQPSRLTRPSIPSLASAKLPRASQQPLRPSRSHQYQPQFSQCFGQSNSGRSLWIDQPLTITPPYTPNGHASAHGRHGDGELGASSTPPVLDRRSSAVVYPSASLPGVTVCPDNSSNGDGPTHNYFIINSHVNTGLQNEKDNGGSPRSRVDDPLNSNVGYTVHDPNNINPKNNITPNHAAHAAGYLTPQLSPLESRPNGGRNGFHHAHPPSLPSPIVGDSPSSLVYDADTIPPSYVPFCGDDFIPRQTDATTSILDDIVDSRSKHRVFCVFGGPGHGKTTFAKHVGEEALKQRCVDAVYFVSFETIFEETEMGPGADDRGAIERNPAKCKALIADAILKVMKTLNHEDPPTALELFCQSIDRSVKLLFILDNVETMSEEASKKSFCGVMHSMTKAQQQNVYLLLTTRDSGVSVAMQTFSRMPPPRKIELAAFNDRESETFLKKFIRQEARLNNKSYLDLIVKNCQGNALGLKLCASFINDDIFDDENAGDFFGDIFQRINQLEDDCLLKIIRTSFDKLKDDEKKFMQAMSVFPGPFAARQAKQMFPKDNDMMLLRMRQKSLINKFEDVDARTSGSKTIIHPFIRAYCRKLDDFEYYRLKFIQVALANLIEVSHKSHQRDKFSEARYEFLSDLPHYESALKLVCEIARSIHSGNNNNNSVVHVTGNSQRHSADESCSSNEDDNEQTRRSLLRTLQVSGILQNLSVFFNFLYHVFSSSQFDLFLVQFLDCLLDLIPKTGVGNNDNNNSDNHFEDDLKDGRELGNGVDHHVVIKSHKIRSSDFFKADQLKKWIEETARDAEYASPIAKAHFYYSHGLYIAKTTFNAPRFQRKATEIFEKAEELTKKTADTGDMTSMVILHYSQISLAIQKTKSRDHIRISKGKEELKELLKRIKETWGTHPITMEVEKSLADVYLKEGTSKSTLLEASCRNAEVHYDAACKMMNQLDITQEQSRVRLLKNRASCLLFVHFDDEEKLKSVEKMYQETRRLLSQCKPCPLKFEAYSAIAVFYECFALAKSDAEDKTKTMVEALRYAEEASTMAAKDGIEIGKGRQNIQKNNDAIKKGEPSSTALKIFGRDKLRGSSPNSSMPSLDGTSIFASN